ncbi:MAG: 30S ribosomal protein S9 [Patescibacteria group bacterium]
MIKKENKENIEKSHLNARYIETIGRRKTSSARVRLSEAAKNSFIVNGKNAREYFQTENQRLLIKDPIDKSFSGNSVLKWKVEVKVIGGGINSQAEAVRHGLSRALVKFDNQSSSTKIEKLEDTESPSLTPQDFKTNTLNATGLSIREKLKSLGYLKRDPRSKERRKFGLKKARKAPQWSKR